MMTIGKPDTFTQGAGVTETIKGVTGGLGAPSLGSLLSESRVLEDEEGPGKGLTIGKACGCGRSEERSTPAGACQPHRALPAAGNLGFL